MYKLTLTKAKTRLGLAKAIRSFIDLPFAEVPKVVDGLQLEPFTIEHQYASPEMIQKIFGDVAEYTYQEHEEYKEQEYAPWDRKEYIDARNWYHSLPQEDKDKIDILVRGVSVPFA